MKKYLNLSIVLLTSFILLSCSGGGLMTRETLMEKLNLSKLPDIVEYPDVDGVILMHDNDVSMEITSDWTLFTRETVTRAKILFRNVEDYAYVQIPIYDGETLENLSAQTIKADGTVIEITEEDFHLVSGGAEGFTYYSDTQKMRFTFPGIEKNCIIQWSYTKRKDFPFRRDIWAIQYSMPIISNTYSLTVPTLLITKFKWDWQYRAYNYILEDPVYHKNINPTQSKKDASVTYKWTLKNVEAFKSEPSMPPFEDNVAYVRFAPHDWQKWNDISEWYYEKLFEPQLDITDKINTLAKELTEGAETDDDKIAKLFNYVQKMRYVSIKLGDSGLRPSFPEKVIEREYGDCKDKSILLIALLRSVGIEAKPVLALTGDNGRLDTSFPAWNFNHMIVKATTGEKDYWLDATVTHCLPGELHSGCEGINVMVMDDDGTCKMETTPVATHKDNLKLYDVKINIDDKNEAEFTVTMTYKGKENFRLRSYLKDQTDEDLEEFFTDIFSDDNLRSSLVSYNVPDVDSLGAELKLNFVFRTPNLIQIQGDLCFVDFDPFNLFPDLSWLSKETRKYDLEFDFPHTIYKNIEINFPAEKYEIRNLPENMVLKNSNVEYRRRFNKVSENKIMFNESYARKKKTIKAFRYPEYRANAEKIRTRIDEKLILTSK